MPISQWFILSIPESAERGEGIMNSKISIVDYGVLARGQNELRRHEAGEKLTYKQMVMVKCYECCAGYTDGKVDCGISGCPLYGKMPYKNRICYLR